MTNTGLKYVGSGLVENLFIEVELLDAGILVLTCTQQINGWFVSKRDHIF